MFPFLLLPREIRDKIYRYLFEGPDGKTCLLLHSALEGVDVCVTKATSEEAWATPPDRWKIMNGWSPSGGLPLFRTCKLVRSEAAASLYGQNWFVFTNEGFKLHRHMIGVIARCAFSFMYDFLRIIGSANRKSIRRLLVVIERPAYLIHKDDPVEGHSWFTSRCSNFTLGEHLVNVFDILSQGHSLDVVGILLRGGEELLQIFLRDVSQSILMQTMMKLNGSINLHIQCTEINRSEMSNIHRTACQSLIDRLASSPEGEDGPSEGKAVESQAQSPSSSQLQLSKRHTELTKRIEERKNTFAQWEKLQLWIQQEEEQGRRDEAESKRVEESLNGLEQVFEDLHLHPGLP